VKFNLGSEYEIRHVVEGLLRGDSAARAAFYKEGIMDGWMNRNEVRELEDRNPAEGLDEFLTPMNLAPTIGSGDGNSNGKGKNLEKEAFRIMAAKLSSQEKSEWVELLREENA